MECYSRGYTLPWKRRLEGEVEIDHAMLMNRLCGLVMTASRSPRGRSAYCVLRTHENIVMTDLEIEVSILQFEGQEWQ